MGGLRWTGARVVLALLMLPPTALAAGDPPPRDVAAAESFFRTGVNAFQSGDYGVALRSLQRAFELHASYRTATMLAQVELQVGRFAQSASHLDFALKLLPDGTQEETRKKLLWALKQTRSRVATIGFRPNVKSAQLFMDGELLSDGRVAHDLYVLPGSYRIEVRADGYLPHIRRLSLMKGSQQELIVNLERVLNTAPEIERSRPAQRSRVRKTLLIGGAGLSLAGLGVGTYGLIRRQKAQSNEDRSRFGGIALGGFIGSAVFAAVTGVVYYSLNDDSEGGATALLFTVGPLPYGKGLNVGAIGTF